MSLQSLGLAHGSMVHVKDCDTDMKDAEAESRAASMDAGESVISRGPTGLTVVNLGTVQNADVNRVRVKAYWGLLNKSEKGIARAKEITS